MKRNVLSILLIFCLIAPITATFIVLQVQKAKVRKEVKRSMIAGIDKDALVLLKFTAKEKKQLRWEHAREFEYDNRMFDVISTQECGDTTLYWCWEDHAETALNSKLESLVAYVLGHNPQHKKNQRRLRMFFKSMFYTPQTKLDPTLAEKTCNISPYYQTHYNSLNFSPGAPPPKMCS